MSLIDWDRIPTPPKPETREEIYLANICKSLLYLLKYYEERSSEEQQDQNET